ncbi:hypothetical protein PISMIDRAFT_404089 [Pisolithus microcarpus 441]|uniref:Unplaced genomic scaffold scaffold_31, whole genome shotgun sequence n=1 Tax=Pisolithus microcarpus 441 TaxID=765257 RepID=A0A0C9Z615_9AGAM|nr:hypothetical protein PISMIDRAFT_404089 [Pisolithus microcarpus 441]
MYEAEGKRRQPVENIKIGTKYYILRVRRSSPRETSYTQILYSSYPKKKESVTIVILPFFRVPCTRISGTVILVS